MHSQRIEESADGGDVVVGEGGVVTTERLAGVISGALGKRAVSNGGVGGIERFNGQTLMKTSRS